MTKHSPAHSPLQSVSSLIGNSEAAPGMDSSNQENYRLRCQELFEFAWDAQVVTDCRGVILEANHAAAALFQYSKEFLVGKPLGLLLKDGARSRFYRCLIELARRGRSEGFESRLDAEGDSKEVMVRGSCSSWRRRGRAPCDGN